MEIESKKLVITLNGRDYEAVLSGPAIPPGTAAATSMNPLSNIAVILTHGAGGDLHFSQLALIANSFARAGVLCLRFTCKGLNIKHRTNVYCGVVDYLQKTRSEVKRCILAGRSMGSRAAVMAAGIQGQVAGHGFIKGVICFSYPLHKPKDKANLRSAPIGDLWCPCLFISGDNDAMCEKDVLEAIIVRKQLQKVHWIEGADHGLSVKHMHSQHIVDDFMVVVLDWLKEIFADSATSHKGLVSVEDKNVISFENMCEKTPKKLKRKALFK